MPTLPSGTVTFLFTDIEGSTKLWEAHPEEMRFSLARHDTILREAIVGANGYVFKTIGDAFCAAFASGVEALAAMIACQRAIASEGWPESTQIKVRMALHTSEIESRDDDYFGQPVNRVARLLAIGHGGQSLLSHGTWSLVRDNLPPGTELINLGEHRLKDLGQPETVFQVCHPDLPREYPPLRSLNSVSLKHNLPQQVTSFIGRERELAEVKDLLGKSRLLTLTGSGGTGKTRLSLQAAADLLDESSDGAWFVELAALSDPSLVPQTVANVLEVKEEPGKPMALTLTEYLKTRQLLLVLDNCEHLLDTCAKLVDDVLRNCPNVLILATSREGLGISGEQTYRVPSLSVPMSNDPKQKQTAESLARYESVRLFVDRATQAQTTFIVTDENAPAVASICYRLDGIPFAIELSAARVRSLSVEEINKKLDQRFRLLTGGSRTALPRQQTLRSMIDWSYDLLNSAEKSLLCRLSVFHGGWTLEAAEAVCPGEGIEDWEILDLLTSHCDKSLAVAEPRADGTRYRLLETVQQYARDRLLEGGGGAAWREQHLAYFVSLAKEAESELQGPNQKAWLERLEAEHDNLRAALDWGADEPESIESGRRLAGALWRFWLVRGYLSEGRERLSRVLADDAACVSESGALALNGAGILAREQGDYGAARELHEKSLQIYRDLGNRPGAATSLNNLGNVANYLGDYAAARALFEESLSIRRELKNRREIAVSLNNLGNVATNQADYAAARKLYEESLTIFRKQGDRRGVAYSLNNLGTVVSRQGDFSKARKHYEESMTIRRELGDRAGFANSLANLGYVALSQGDYAAARTLYEEGLAIFQALGDRQGIANTLGTLGTAALNLGDDVLARSYFEESLAIQRDLGTKGGVAISLSRLGNVAVKQGDYKAARALYRESMSAHLELGDRAGIATSLYGLATVASLSASYDESLKAVRLWGAAERLTEELGAALLETEASDHEQQVSAARDALGDNAAFDAAWADGRAMSMERAIYEALE